MNTILSKKWSKKRPPKKILAIRLQAMGDTVITLPYLQDLRNRLPAEVQLDLLTRKEVEAIPQSLCLFDRVYSIGGKRNFKKQVLLILLMLPRLLYSRYEVVIDLQNNLISRIVRICLFPKAWCAFDKYSSSPAGERTRRTIEAAGLGAILFSPRYSFKSISSVDPLLKHNGWDGKSDLFIINPAGAFPTRNWNLEYYAQFARLWLRYAPQTQFVITGLSQLQQKASYLKSTLGDHLIDLVEKCTPVEAFHVVRKASLMLSEDSGLMHMSWTNDRPTVLLLGSTRSDWVLPQNNRSLVLSSGDLPCGNCMLAICPLGTIKCLNRYTPEIVFEKVRAFVTAGANKI